MIKSFIARNIFYPMYCWLYQKNNSLSYYESFNKAQWNTLEENKKIQAGKLYKLIKYASENIPYYKHIVSEKDITFSKDSIFEDIKRFPTLTKTIMKKEFKNLHLIRDNLKWYYNTSGGSTGEPVRFIQDFDYYSESCAMSQIMDAWAGCRTGDTLIELWGSEKDILGQKENIKHRFANWIKSIYLLNSFSMDNKKMASFVDIINKKKPKMILAYTQSIYEFARFIKSRGLKVYSPSSIMTSAGTLFPHFRSLAEQVFKCPIFNRYGSREVGNIACECEKHEGLHTSMFTHYVEILDKNLEPCKEGECGEIYITLLSNFTMPLIRYKIGDMAVHTEKKCSCGRGLQLIREVAGRNNDMFITKNGELVHTGIINYQFYYKDFIKKYQVIQKRPDEIIIKIVFSEQNTAKNYDSDLISIKEKIKQVMGQCCKINFEFVDDIKPTKSGKYRYTIREF